MMRQMRENTKWIMLITALAFVALMVFEWGMDLTGRSGSAAAGGELGRVNGDPISYEEYNVVYQNLYQQQQAAMETPIPPLMVRQIEEAAWDQVVTQKLLTQELRRRDIAVTNAEIQQAARLAPPPELQSAPAFLTDGEFDITKYHQFLGSPSLDENFLRQLEAYYRDVIPRSKLYFQTTAGVHVTDGQLWRLWQDANETVRVRFIAFSPEQLVPDSDVTITDAAVRQHYNDHRDDYLRPAQANVRYVIVPRAPGAADSAAARQRAAELRAALVGGESFEAVAERSGGDPTQGRFNGEPFTVMRGQSAPALEQAVFSAPIAQVTEPIATQAGLHLVRVEARGADTARVRQILVPIELSVENENRLLGRADSLERIGERAGLDQAARQLNLQVRAGEVSPALPILAGVGAVDEGVDWIFEEATVGEVSPAFETAEAFYMIELVSRRDEATLSLQEATPTIRTLLLRQAKIDRARQRLAEGERMARAGQPLDQIAASYRTSVQEAGPFTRGDFVPGLGRLNAAIGAAFGLQPGQTSGLVEAEGQLVLVQTVERTPADREEWQRQLEEQRARVQQAVADTRWQQYMSALRESAEIVDNRRELLRPAGTATSRR